jgi:hypothetical protein
VFAQGPCIQLPEQVPQYFPSKTLAYESQVSLISDEPNRLMDFIAVQPNDGSMAMPFTSTRMRRSRKCFLVLPRGE